MKLCGCKEPCFDNSKDSYGSMGTLCDFLSEKKTENGNVGICTKFDNEEVKVYTTEKEYIKEIKNIDYEGVIGVEIVEVRLGKKLTIEATKNIYKLFQEKQNEIDELKDRAICQKNEIKHLKEKLEKTEDLFKSIRIKIEDWCDTLDDFEYQYLFKEMKELLNKLY